jgi:hypothetical protein
MFINRTAAFSLGTFFDAVVKESTSPVGAKNLAGLQ